MEESANIANQIDHSTAHGVRTSKAARQCLAEELPGIVTTGTGGAIVLDSISEGAVVVPFTSAKPFKPTHSSHVSSMSLTMFCVGSSAITRSNLTFVTPNFARVSAKALVKVAMPLLRKAQWSSVSIEKPYEGIRGM